MEISIPYFLKGKFFPGFDHGIVKYMDAQWLNKQFELNQDKSKAGLAKALRLEPSAVSKILKGTRQIKAQEYATMRQYFGLPVDGEKSIGNRKSASYTLEPLSQPENLRDSDTSRGEEWVIPSAVISQRTKADSRNIKIFSVDETAMEPDFKRGEPVLVDLSDTEPSPPGVFVVSDGFGYLIRQCEFVAGSNPAEIKLSAVVKNFQPQILGRDDFKIIGRVIAKLQWL